MLVYQELWCGRVQPSDLRLTAPGSVQSHESARARRHGYSRCRLGFCVELLEGGVQVAAAQLKLVACFGFFVQIVNERRSNINSELSCVQYPDLRSGASRDFARTRGLPWHLSKAADRECNEEIAFDWKCLGFFSFPAANPGADGAARRKWTRSSTECAPISRRVALFSHSLASTAIVLFSPASVQGERSAARVTPFSL